MANAKTWPSSLPVPLLSSANVSGSHGYESSDMESGLLRQYQRQPRPTARRSYEMYCTTFQSARALDFLEKLSGASFNMSFALPGDPDTSSPTVSARYLGEWDWRAIDERTGMFSFTAFIEALPAPKPDGYYDLYDVLGGQFDLYMQSLEDQVNAALLD